ncbi:hypothetical protein A1359_04090 [Methylomonas lenta]|uniref:Uncharacterized protein n=1 Tax=Methylomonas lenta TaxID=980561 RepID=A0A177NL20_9GAMM|nr:hypothetical protein [Methylomonas lenta]OAI18758.1 hypothetical protein A1359_04090 [Methylomonas lenta]
MLSANANTTGKQDMIQLHAATCLMMTRFINGRHCPKLAHVIVQQLQKLLSHPVTQEIPDSRDMYLQLLEHWQSVLSSLLEQKQAARPSHLY